MAVESNIATYDAIQVTVLRQSVTASTGAVGCRTIPRGVRSIGVCVFGDVGQRRLEAGGVQLCLRPWGWDRWIEFEDPQDKERSVG